jgi:hypothetical protein
MESYPSGTLHVCKFVEMEGGCKQGDACPFKHPGREKEQKALAASHKSSASAADTVPETGFAGIPVPKAKKNVVVIKVPKQPLNDSQLPPQQAQAPAEMTNAEPRDPLSSVKHRATRAGSNGRRGQVNQVQKPSGETFNYGGTPGKLHVSEETAVRSDIMGDSSSRRLHGGAR